MSAPELLPQIEQSTTRQHFTDIRHVNVRWEPYKADGARQMKAKGRWQEQVGSGDYWRWQNCDRPAFAHAPAPDIGALVEALTPSGDTKAAYMGEIKDPETKRVVSWTAIKMVMAMIADRAALKGGAA